MEILTLTVARALIDAAADFARERNLAPLAIVVLDARGATKASVAQDGTSLKRYEVAHGKCYGALAMGLGSRTLFARAKEQAYFVSAISHIVGGHMVPVPGGVLIRDSHDQLIGAMGISGDTSDNDELVAIAAIEAAGLTADPGKG
jgi:uncharacterized protein GlcG (DUF336 family)